MIADVYLTPNTFYSVIDTYQNINPETTIDELKLVHPNIKTLIDKLNITYDDLFQDNITIKNNFLKINSRFLYLKHVESIDDTKKFIFKKGRKYFYHLYQDCEGLNNLTYHDYELPEDIVKRDDENLINIFRIWFKSLFKDKLSIENITNKYNSEFAVNHNLTLIERFEEVTSQKDKLVCKTIKQNYYLDIRNSEIESLIKEVSSKNLNEEGVSEFKKRALYLIYECYFWHKSSIDKLQDLCLEDFGLIHCRLCESKRKEEQRLKLIKKSNLK